MMATRSLGCASWLASRFAARLHILSATPRVLPAREELTRLKVPEQYWRLVTLHQTPAYPTEAILEACARHQVELVVMTCHGETAEVHADKDRALSKVIGSIARETIEQSAAPVLLLPPSYQETLPWERILAPLSGETELDEALVLAVRLASALHLDVHVAHVVDRDTGQSGLSARVRYADAFHHEYPGQLDEMVRHAVPRCTLEERRCIVDVDLCRGNVAEELLALIDRKRISLVVLGWHGLFLAGRARVLSPLIQATASPILLVKYERRPGLKLKVGEELESPSVMENKGG
jgi:nucleotide-binding universal stress UspA family protein